MGVAGYAGALFFAALIGVSSAFPASAQSEQALSNQRGLWIHARTNRAQCASVNTDEGPLSLCVIEIAAPHDIYRVLLGEDMLVDAQDDSVSDGALGTENVALRCSLELQSGSGGPNGLTDRLCTIYQDGVALLQVRVDFE